MKKIEEKYGNKHMILSLLIDEIRSLPVVKKRDLRSFEQLSLRVNDFHDRLELMGCKLKAENSYVLREIESKLNADNLQRWLESRGTHVDTRKVGDLVFWLDQQVHLKRISHQSSANSGTYDENCFGKRKVAICFPHQCQLRIIYN